ncbi:MAG: cell division ATP-binding protein FtsE [Desulfotomaculum sp.]|nr:cell division ATP-binding protein FtsE [Desulfotomaculum sp.]
MIQFYNVSKIYKNKVPALLDVTLRIKKGEFLFLVGPSGAGKSTLIKLIYREEVPSRGQVMFNGKNITRFSSGEVSRLRRKIGMVFQDFRLLPNKTVAENIAFALEVTGASRENIRQAVPLTLAKVGLAKKIDQYPAKLSGGEQQRVVIARAIINNPVLIIADEPTGNLDPDTSGEIMKLFQNINRSGTTIIMSTHAWDIVDRMKHRVIRLKNGKVEGDEDSGVYNLAT